MRKEIHSLTTSLDERLKQNAKLYSVKLFKRVLKMYVRGGDEGREWRRREGRDWEGRRVKGGKGKRERERGEGGKKRERERERGRERGGGGGAEREGKRGERKGKERERERERKRGKSLKIVSPQNKKLFNLLRWICETFPIYWAGFT